MSEVQPPVGDGVRLLSQRPSLLRKLSDVATSDDAAHGLLIAGPQWDERLRAAADRLAPAERAGVWAVRLDDPGGVPLPIAVLAERLRTDWFPSFLFRGRMHAVFQPVIDINTGAVYAREALIRGSLGRGEVSGAELIGAAVAHDALFSFDARARGAALESGLPQLPEGERLFVKLDLRAVIDVAGAVRSLWPAAEAAGGRPEQLGVELMGVDGSTDLTLLCDVAAAHRERGAVIALDDLSVSTDTVRTLELLRPDVVKLGRRMCRESQTSPARQHLVGAVVEVAHELGARVVAVGVERDTDLEHVRGLGVDLAQGFYLAQPTTEMLPVQQRPVVRSAA